jgi:hypothetical protein
MSEMTRELTPPPSDTAVAVRKNAFSFKETIPWLGWLNGIATALYRPQVITLLTFPLTAAQDSSELAVVFPAGTVEVGDVPLVSAPDGSTLPASCFTARIQNVDEVLVRFNNYSAGALQPPAGNFTVTVLKQ